MRRAQPERSAITAESHAGSIAFMRHYVPQLSPTAALYYLRMPSDVGRGNAMLGLLMWTLYPWAHARAGHLPDPKTGHTTCIYCNKWQKSGLAMTGVAVDLSSDPSRPLSLAYFQTPACTRTDRLQKQLALGKMANVVVLCQTCHQQHAGQLLHAKLTKLNYVARKTGLAPLARLQAALATKPPPAAYCALTSTHAGIDGLALEQLLAAAL